MAASGSAVHIRAINFVESISSRVYYPEKLESTPAPIWANYISPSGLKDLIWNTVPYLRECAPDTPFLRIIAEDIDAHIEEESVLSYFRLCLAAHHATVATYVPTDVDSKIRGLLWRDTKDLSTLRAMAGAAMEMHTWTLDGFSLRTVDCGEYGIVSGHDGEWLSVASGALGRFLSLGHDEDAAAMHDAIHAELLRESRAFFDVCAQPGRELDTMRLAMSITHNLGDLNQGISFWSGAARASASARQFERLAQENADGYEGVFKWPSALYKELLASEGHRHYPLRAIKPLRRSPALMLPLGPFFDDYGATLAQTKELNIAEKAETLEALVRGCKKVPNQHGYYRAIAGFKEASQRTFDQCVDAMPNAAQKLLKEPDMRQRIAIPRRSFESAYVKRVESMRRQIAAARK